VLSFGVRLKDKAIQTVGKLPCCKQDSSMFLKINISRQMYPQNCSGAVYENMLICTLCVKHFEKGEFVNCQLNIQEQE